MTSLNFYSIELKKKEKIPTDTRTFIHTYVPLFQQELHRNTIYIWNAYHALKRLSNGATRNAHTRIYIHVYSWKRFDGEFFFPGHNGNRIGARLGFLINGIGRVKEETD